ncbi:MAG: TlpA family protein disulfide reductase [Armatimonadetes bacterium]|nr:TlpA family protein disulfide reductase [Armatimonadota bacterium]
MKGIRTSIFCAFALVSSLSFAQKSTGLSIGDKAPAFSVEGWVKGSVDFTPGNVYVVEFWATWCGPCISAMPHLSDMADKMKGKVDFISINTWDRRPEGEKNAKDAGHVKRVSEWVAQNSEKMRYNIALDDEKETMANTWMRAAGRNGIPCAFVVNRDGVIAWIGHPMSGMDKVVQEVYDNKFDIAAAKAAFDKEAAAAAAEQAKSKELMDAAQTGNLATFEGVWKKQTKDDKKNAASTVMNATSSLAAANHADVAFEFLTNRSKDVLKGKASEQVTCAFVLSRRVKNNPTLLTSIFEFAVKASNSLKDDEAAISYAYLADVAFAAGEKGKAADYVAKAESMIAKFMPEANRKSIGDYIAGVKARVTK